MREVCAQTLIGFAGGKEKKKPEPALMNCLCNPRFQRLYYDVRDDPGTALLHTVGDPPYPLPLSTRTMPISAPEPLKSIKLISRMFPWSLDLQNDSGITLQDLLLSAHNFFFTKILEGEYWGTSDDVRARLNTAFHANCAATIPSGGPNVTIGYGGAVPPKIGKPRSKDFGLIRVDWLLDHTIITGLEKDDTLAAYRYPFEKDRSRMWVLSLGPNI